MNYIRNDNENLKQYQHRLYKNKDLYGLTFDEIGEILNNETGNKWSESAYRKPMTSYIEGYDEGYEKGYSDALDGDTNEILEEIENKKDELYKQQVKTRDKLREYRATLRDEARVENLRETFVRCAKDISVFKPLVIDDNIVKINGDNVGVLSLSDLHYGELINNFMNEYNADVFYDRMQKITKDTVEYCKLMNVNTLKVLNLGDWVTGNIHVSSRVNSEEDIVEQIMIVAEIASEMLAHFARHIEKVEFYSVTDNHSRVNKNRKEHIEKESFSRFIPWFIKERVSRIPNINIINNKINDVEEFELGVFNIFNEKAFFVHGHNDKITSVVPDLTLMTKMFPIAIFIGHLHRNYEDEIHGIDLIMNPSAVGTGEFAKSIRKSSRPRQKLTVFSNKDGLVERISTFFINL